MSRAMKITYNDWKATRTKKSAEEMIKLTGDEAFEDYASQGDVDHFIYFRCDSSYITVYTNGTYHLLIGNEEWESDDLEHLMMILWINWSKEECNA